MAECVGKEGVAKSKPCHSWEDKVKVVPKEIFKQARGDGCAEVPLLVAAPTNYKGQDFLRVRLDVLAHRDDRLPPWIQSIIWRRYAGQKRFGASDCFMHGHDGHLTGIRQNCLIR